MRKNRTSKHYQTFAELKIDLQAARQRRESAFNRLTGVEKLCLKFYKRYFEHNSVVEWLEGYKQAMIDERWTKKREKK